ncbi:MAG: hypothetical protein Q7T93_04890 [Methylobacterium sp.]|jgi:hypothetical protein|uniref:hypothetical protein n=1 Tax=unclassified Methylobacterium TaxID=2615210 RepID=UPI000ABD2179|nr:MULTISPECIES: hypothetical protein [unclassified Methylobacterium]MDO9426148.1 hypothetical protein [Methylobacterium sp.]
MADDHDEKSDGTAKKPANVAPDAVKDPNEKTGGKPGQGPKGGGTPDDETDPGGG